MCWFCFSQQCFTDVDENKSFFMSTLFFFFRHFFFSFFFSSFLQGVVDRQVTINHHFEQSLSVKPLRYEMGEIFKTSLPRDPDGGVLLVGCLIMRREEASLEEVVNTPIPIPCLIPSRWVRLYDVVADDSSSRGIPCDENDAATLIQAVVRGVGVRSCCELRYQAILLMQKMARGMVARMDWRLAELARIKRAQRNVSDIHRK